MMYCSAKQKHAFSSQRNRVQGSHCVDEALAAHKQTESARAGKAKLMSAGVPRGELTAVAHGPGPSRPEISGWGILIVINPREEAKIQGTDGG